MSFVVRAVPKGLTTEKYNESLRRLETAGIKLSYGRRAPLCALSSPARADSFTAAKVLD